MRFYLKLIVLTVVAGSLGITGMRQAANELAADVQIHLIWRFGSPADREALMDRLQRNAAAAVGGLELYEFGKRYQQLLDARLAEAGMPRGTPLSDEEFLQIQRECVRQAQGLPAVAPPEPVAVAFCTSR
jgi:hypothetical protein